MNRLTAVDPPTSLSAGAVDLLETFCRSHGGLDVRLWVRPDGEWNCLYPAGGCAAKGPAGGSVRHTIDPDGSAAFELEVGGADTESPDLGLLAEALGQVLGYEQEADAAAGEITERYEEINLLYSISEVLGSVLSLQEAAGRILSEVVDVLGGRRASLWVYDAEEELLRRTATVGEAGMSGPVPVDDPDSITARVFRECESISLERGTVLPRGARLEPRPRDREAFLSVPVNYTPPEGHSRTVGVITLVGGTGNERFSAGDARLLSAIASQIGAALEMHQLVQESLRQERLVRELELAHDLQLKLLPETAKFEGPAQVAARCAPADSVGGDLYHLFQLSGGRLGIMIGDVSGHGFSAALIMALTMSAVAISAREAGPPAELLRRVHRALIDELETTEMYLTLFYGVIDPAAEEMVYANAGHPHAFCVRSADQVERLGATNPPLGMLPLDEYAEAVVPWNPGQDLLCLFTDGLSDAFADNGGPSGESGLIDEVLALRDGAPREILDRLFAAAEGRRLGVPPDDRTAVLVRV